MPKQFIKLEERAGKKLGIALSLIIIHNLNKFAYILYPE
jgi:hypothetical protein